VRAVPDPVSDVPGLFGVPGLSDVPVLPGAPVLSDIPVLDVAGLHVGFGDVEAVRGVSLQVRRGETHCLVGESGCGKSALALAVMGLLVRGARRTAGRLRFGDIDLLPLSDRAMGRLRGDRIGMVFQDPMTSLNPAYTVGSQLTEVYRHHRGGHHRGGARGAAVERAAELLGRVGIAAPGLRMRQFPHQLSGGLRQRVMIALALICSPALLIADEPTTALDVTVQAGILRLLMGLQADMGLALLLITHDLGVVARVAHRVSVMYAGEIVESAPVADLFAHPSHPYTQGLLASVPVPGQGRRDQPLGSIPGTVPRLPPGFVGCGFRGRCAHAMPACADPVPLRRRTPDHAYLCLLPPA
jgi:oligopeptide/dipeptide ABC transporter ATP-binding protein